MRKATIENGKICPNCGKKENQVKIGYNRSGTQRCRCKECGTRYTLNPKKHEYSDKTKELAIKMYYSGVSGRGVGKALGMNKANVYNWIKKKKKKKRRRSLTKIQNILSLMNCIGLHVKKVVNFLFFAVDFL